MCGRSVTAFLAPPRSQHPGQGPRSPHPKADPDPMYQYNDRLTQLFTKYEYIRLWLQCFDPYLGHRQAYIMNLKSVVHAEAALAVRGAYGRP
jgi:hypothetical protein